MPMFPTSADLPIDANAHAISESAGGDGDNRYDHAEGRWYLDAPTQAALDAAVASYDHDAEVLAARKPSMLRALSAHRFAPEIERKLAEAIAGAGNLAELDAIDMAAGWPNN